MKKQLTLFLFFLIIGISTKANDLTITHTTGCTFVIMTANDLVMHVIPPIWVSNDPITLDWDSATASL